METKQPEETSGEMRKRRETMPDGRRYIIYYTFGNQVNDSGEVAAGSADEVKKDV